MSSLVSIVTNLFNATVVQRPSQDGTCPAEEDRGFGPTIRWCRLGFDFSLLFQQTILSILPSAVFIILAVVRVGLAVATVSIAIQAAVLVVQSQGSSLNTAASVPAAALSLAASLLAAVLSAFEHQKTHRPSSLMLAFLFLATLFAVVRTRTYWIMAEPALTGLFAADCLVKLLFFSLEARNKTSSLIEAHDGRSTEETAGPISKTFYWWLNRLFRAGYRRSFSAADVGPIDSLLYSKRLSAKIQPLLTARQGPGLVYVAVKCLGLHALSPVLPRLAVTAFTFSQSFLVTAILNHLDARDTPKTHGYGLIGACVLVYGGIAVATSWYWRQVYRLVSMVRGALVMAISEKSLRLREDPDTEAKAITLMTSDVQRIVSALEFIHEVWAGAIETGLATYLLYRLVGVSCITMLGLALATGGCCIWVSKKLSLRQQVWLVAIQSRLAATKRLLDSLKAITMMGTREKVSGFIQELRALEIKAARPFRGLISVSLFLSYSVLMLSPLLVFATYIGVSGVAHELDSPKMFSSLVVISLVASPLIHVFQALPAIGSAHACFKRILAFLQMPERRHEAEPTTGTEGCSKSLSHVSQDGICVSLRGVALGWASHKPILRNVNLEVEKGAQVAIVGPVGSGKSLFIKSLVGESEQLAGYAAVPRGQVAYCGQTPWLENISAERSWMQHLVGDKDFAAEVRTCCGLGDIEALSDYRTGTIGSGGVRLSGGQRQRLALARAVASRKPLVLLDDVFSALDGTTKQLVSGRLLGPSGLFSRLGTTVILTTHDKQIAALANEVYEITDQGDFNPFSAQSMDESDSMEEIKVVSLEHDSQLSAKEKHENAGAEPSTSKSSCNQLTLPPKPCLPDTMSDKAVYMCYIRAMGFVNALAFLALGVIFALCSMLPNLWLQWWSSALSKESKDSRGIGYWMGVFGMLQVIPLVVLCVWVLHLMLKVVPKSAITLHSALLRATLRAPFSYISRVDTGSLINRFNSDLMFVDTFLPLDLFNTASEFFTAIFQMILTAMVAYQALAMLPVLAIAIYLIQRVYLRTSKQLRHLDLELKGHLHTQFGETTSGIITIRANGWTEAMRAKFLDKLDRSQEPFYLLHMAQRWLQLVLGLVTAGLAVAIASIVVALRDKLIVGVVGVAFLNVTMLGSTLTNFVVAWTSLETSLGAIARISLFVRDTPDEERDESSKGRVLGQEWCRNGHVCLENVFATYAPADGDIPETIWALRGVDLEILPGQRVAVCGRTASGKSSLLLSLLGMLEIPIGRILIDGIDIATVQLETLRQRLRVISQEAFTESAHVTFRQELDPEGRHADDFLMETLRDFGIWDSVSAAGGLDGNRSDASFSSGQAQLFLLARLAVNESRTPGGIIILDEATSRQVNSSRCEIGD
ncbi:canalicular multispecific organic anion transporter 1 [Ophiocordyceps sinensis CO18]|uniref:Canalicular multispecific organic anion transporter 1 n=1 Tax=Ophiocordyceps sinensis (strain Co18 / CGMCC 3.14243) TaxID=911162 RepID=T5ADZ0_OPHSC|nr:canalicular multispecific organic anion transporter 1 [Ophiocordyceps sinensis CO18]